MLFKGVQVGGGSDNNEKYATYNSGGMVGGGTGERGGQYHAIREKTGLV